MKFYDKTDLKHNYIYKVNSQLLLAPKTCTGSALQM